MKTFFNNIIIVIIYYIHYYETKLTEGELCVDRRTAEFGTCMGLSLCASAREDIRQNIHPTLCSYSTVEAVICCRNASESTTISSIPARNSNKSQPLFDKFNSTIESVRTNRGLISLTKCFEYQSFAILIPPIELHRPPAVVYSLMEAEPVVEHDADQISSRFVKPQTIGGKETSVHEFPHMAAIGWYLLDGNILFKCGGSLISERFVLTAAHCTKCAQDTQLAELEPKVVRLGAHNILHGDISSWVDINIQEIIKHPNYKPPAKYYDIALLKLDTDVTFSPDIKPACLWTGDEDEINSVIATGWGTTVAGSPNHSPVLNKVTLDIMSNILCDMLLLTARNRHWQGFKKHQLCAGVLAGGKDSCQGDSGGPLQVPVFFKSMMIYSIVGITSFGKDCAKPNKPAVYTRVSYFIDWIEGIVW